MDHTTFLRHVGEGGGLDAVRKVFASSDEAHLRRGCSQCCRVHEIGLAVRRAVYLERKYLKLVDLPSSAVNAGRIYMLACVGTCELYTRLRTLINFGTVVLFYDYIVTFDLEVNHIWKRKKNIISYLFLIVRLRVPALST